MIKAMIIALSLQLLLTKVVLADEPAIGRLFSTPEQRKALNHLREIKKNQPQEPETIVEATVIERKPVSLPDHIHVQGYVKRTDGKLGTVWVNDEMVQETSRNKGVQIGRIPKNSNRVPIRIPANGRRLSLKAGQEYDPAKNQIIQSRSYKINRSFGRIGNE